MSSGEAPRSGSRLFFLTRSRPTESNANGFGPTSIDAERGTHSTPFPSHEHPPQSESPSLLSSHTTTSEQAGTMPQMNFIDPTPRAADVPLPTEDPNLLAPSRRGTMNTLATSRTSATYGSTLPGWDTAIKEAIFRDNMLLDEWRSSMDVLLIFATLFAAIITAFIVESYKTLKGDSERTVQLLELIAERLGAEESVIHHTVYHEIPIRRVQRVNRLWFASLCLTIGSAIFAMLAKQWLTEYTEGLSVNPRRTSSERLQREAVIREFRYRGLKRWYVPEVIGGLPIILHAALLLFAVGLVDFLWTLDLGTAIVILVFTAVIFSTYWIFVILTSIFPGCPYKTPLSHLITNITHNSAWYLHSAAWRKRTRANDPDGESARWGGALLRKEQNVVDKDGQKLVVDFLEGLDKTTRSYKLQDWAKQEIEKIRSKSYTGEHPEAHMGNSHLAEKKNTGAPPAGADAA